MEIEGFFAGSAVLILFTITKLIVNAGDLIRGDVQVRGDVVVCIGFGRRGMIRLRKTEQNQEVFLMDQIYNEVVMDHDCKFLPSHLCSDYEKVASI